MLVQADISKPLPIKSNTFHCIVTSPPYYNLRDYDIEPSVWGEYPQWRGALGQEPSKEMYVRDLVWCLKEPMRTLREDGVMFLNIGDSYDDDGNKSFIPHMVAIKMQEIGWLVKQDIIWAKAVSFNPSWSGSVMPEPINGWRYERHKVPSDSEKTKEYRKELEVLSKERGTSSHRLYVTDRPELTMDCPGCEICLPNNGFVLRKSQWRPTCSHEYIFMVAKSDKYFCDREAVKEPTVDGTYTRNVRSIWTFEDDKEKMIAEWIERYGKNMKSTISVGTGNYKGKHFAAFSGDLVDPLIRVATSEKGVCPKCGNQWARVVRSKSVERTEIPVEHPAHRPKEYQGKYQELHQSGVGQRYNITDTTGWAATCTHNLTPIAAIVFDPFMGSGTTGMVARALGRRWCGTDIGMDYLLQARERTHIAAFERFEHGIDGSKAELGDLPMFSEAK